jgi:hypothetical protein
MKLKIFGYICILLAILFLFGATFWCWLFRDGMGPDSLETSTGVHAWLRFWDSFQYALLYSIPILIFGARGIFRKKKL